MPAESAVGTNDARPAPPEGERFHGIATIAREQGVSFATVWRWLLKGAVGPDGQRVRLEGWRLGGKWVTTHSALARFMTRLTPSGDRAGAVPSRPPTPMRRRRAAERAIQELDRMGL